MLFPANLLASTEKINFVVVCR